MRFFQLPLTLCLFLLYPRLSGRGLGQAIFWARLFSCEGLEVGEEFLPVRGFKSCGLGLEFLMIILSGVGGGIYRVIQCGLDERDVAFLMPR